MVFRLRFGRGYVLPALFLALTHAAVIASQQPPRDAAAGGPVLLRGRVVTADGAPVRRVRVTVQNSSGVPAYTDDQGAFQLIVPSSAGGLRLTKSGFVSQTVGRRDLPPQGELVVRLAKGAGITGMVIDHLGAPAAGVRVRVRRIAEAGTQGGGQQYTVESDDLGEFRVGNLPAGRYAAAPLPREGGGRGRGGIDELVAAAGGATALNDLLAGARGRGELEQLIAGLRGGGGAPANQGRGGGRGGRGGRGAAPTTSPNEPTVELTEGQEASLLVLLEAPTSTAAATPPPQPAAASGPNGNASIRGRVLSHDATPLAGATVQLLPADGNAVRRSAVTGTDGRYEIGGLAPGRFRVRVTRTGLPEVEYGQARSLQAGRIVDLLTNQRLQGIDVTMPRGSAVIGALIDEWGEPVEGATVEVWQSRFVGGRTSLSPASSIRSRRTDDRGRYRLYGLLPGTYYVSVADEGARAGGGGGGGGRGGGGRGDAGPGAGSSGTRVFYPGTATIESAVPIQIETGLDAAGVDIVFGSLRLATIQGLATSTTGLVPRGRAVLAVSERSGAPMLPLRTAVLGVDGSFAFANVSPGEYIVQVLTGNEGGRGRGGDGGGRGGRGGDQGARGGDQVARGGGQGTRGGGQGAGGVDQGGRGGRGGDAGGRGGRGGATAGAAGGTGAQGGAAAPGIATPGGANIGRGGGRGRGQQPQFQTAANQNQAAPREFGAQYVNVGDGGVVAVQVETSPATRLTGEIQLRGGTSTEAASAFGITALPADQDMAPLAGLRTMRATVREDFTFEMTDLAGSLRFVPARAPEGWWLESVSVNGVNGVDGPVLFGRDMIPVTNVVAVFASGAGAIEGRVVDDARKPPAEFSVIVFAADPDRWFSGSPYLRLASSSRDGTFSATGLPPSDYYAVAVDRLNGGADYGDWQNPAVLATLAAAGRSFNLTKGERVSTELRLAAMPR
jgi:protocatechuate 3,4-dioxygenase beta subunit